MRLGQPRSGLEAEAGHSSSGPRPAISLQRVGQLHRVVQGRAFGLEHRVQVGERLLRLLVGVPSDVPVQGLAHLPGAEDELTGTDRMGVGRRVRFRDSGGDDHFSIAAITHELHRGYTIYYSLSDLGSDLGEE